MTGAEISCWDLSRFGLENRRNSSKIFNYNIYLPFYLLFVLWSQGTHVWRQLKPGGGSSCLHQNHQQNHYLITLIRGKRGGSEIALSKKKETGKVSVAKFYRITSDYLLPCMRVKVQTFPTTRRNFNFAPGLFDIS
jgi:hypothetical protein